MKKSIAAAVLAAGLCGTGYAQLADGFYVGSIKANVYQMNQPKPQKIKDFVILGIQGNEVFLASPDSGNYSGIGATGQLHGFYSGQDGTPVSISLHFGKDYQSVKGLLRSGEGGGDGGFAIEGSFSVKRTEMLPPAPVK